MLQNIIGKKLVAFSNTRWNIIYLVMKRMIQLKIDINEYLVRLHQDELRRSKWNQIENFCKFFEPFNRYTDMSSSESKTTISMTIVIFKTLEQHLKSYEKDRLFRDYAKNINKNIKERFDYIFSFSNEGFDGIYLLSTFLDPRFRILLTNSQKEKAMEVLKEISELFDLNLNNSNNKEPVAKKRRFAILENISSQNIQFKTLMKRSQQLH